MKELENQPAPPERAVDLKDDLYSILVDSALHGHQPSAALMASLFSTLQTTTTKVICQSVEHSGIDYHTAAANDDIMTPVANPQLRYGTG